MVTKKYPAMEKGEKFGDWEIIESEIVGSGKPNILCRCKCGVEKYVNKSALRNGKSKSCHKCAMKDFHRPQIDYGIHPGDHVGYWEILSQHGYIFECKCICGKIKRISIMNLMSGKTTSCGCKRGEKFSDGQKRGKKLGYAMMTAIHNAGLSPGYTREKVNINSRTGICGVNRLKSGKYRSYITLDKKQIHLGTYDDINDAANARKEAEEKYFSPRIEKIEKIKENIKNRYNREEEP